MKKKSTVIFLIILVIITAAGLALMYINHISGLNQRTVLNNEFKAIAEISSVLSDDNTKRDELYKHLNSCVASGKYAVVEKAAKEYYKKYFDDNLQTYDFLSDENNKMNILTEENLTSDDSDLSNTKAFLTRVSQHIEERKAVFINDTSDEVIDSYIKNSDLPEFYISLYYSYTKNSIQQSKESYLDYLNGILEEFTKAEEIINFLADNRSEWTIENNEIDFSTPALTEEFSKMYDEFVK